MGDGENFSSGDSLRVTLPITNYQLPITHSITCQLSTVNCQPKELSTQRAVNPKSCQPKELSTVNCQLSTQRAVNCI